MKLKDDHIWPYPLSTRENHLWDSQIRASILNGVCLIMGYFMGHPKIASLRGKIGFLNQGLFPLKCQVPFLPQRRKPVDSSSVRPHITRQRHIEHLSPIARGTAGDGNVGSLSWSADHAKKALGCCGKDWTTGLILGCLDWLDWDFRENLEEAFWNFIVVDLGLAESEYAALYI